MDTNLIISFLRDIATNNNREWFTAHREEYEKAKADFENGVGEVIAAISRFDTTIAHLTPRDCCYRFYRDLRFSQDKSPYKLHFGAYICAHGKKSLLGGYYIHLQPAHSLIAVGAYWLPNNILTSMRNEIMGNIDEWRKAVENKQFLHLYGRPNQGQWNDEHVDEKGFGLTCLKKVPKGFPADWEFANYLKMKDYCAWRAVSDDFFSKPNWTKELARVFKVAKPMIDFTNSVISDYED